MTDVKLTRCYPCVSAGLEPKTRAKIFRAEIRIEALDAVPIQLDGRQLHSTETSAFQELIAKVKRLPSLLQSFEIVVGREVLSDADRAADAIWQHLPRCHD